MKNIILKTCNIILAACLAACGSGQTPLPESDIKTKSALGQKLFSDKRLSKNRTQSCATCHNPQHAFIDNRLDANNKIGSASLGDDGISLGDRNTPTAAYAAISPDFHQGKRIRITSKQADYQGFIGGQFLDGRQLDLAGQASKPPLAAGEMGLADKAEVSLRIQESQEYVAAFKQFYDAAVFDRAEDVFAAMTDSIAAFEKTATFSPFTSKYDKSLMSPPQFEYDPLSKAAAGKALFFSQQFTNCATCHQLVGNNTPGETFSSYEYHNIGVPVNEALRTLNGKGTAFIDRGLQGNTLVADASAEGKFKVPTLRNVAVTEPYMHNGVFLDLKTVIEFYDHFQTGSSHTLNPETGTAWRDPEVNKNLATAELQDGRALTGSEVEHLVCFMRTLTDERYEALIQNKGIDCGL